MAALDFATPPNIFTESYDFTTRDVPTEPELVAQINFQPDGSIVPDGYSVDGGHVYDITRGYGWTDSIVAYEQDASSDQRLDTYVRVVNSSPADWNYDLLDGDYLVTAVACSPEYTGIHTVAIEGTVVIDSVFTDGGEFVAVQDHPVTVADGQLTVTIGNPSTSKKTKLCSLHITRPN